jgi:hypothetical protein
METDCEGSDWMQLAVLLCTNNWFERAEKFLIAKLIILSRVTIVGFWIGGRIYWTL